MSNNATKSDLKNTAGVDPSKFAKKTDFASLKSEIYKLFNGQLVSGSAGLIKLSSVVENNVIKTTVYINWLKTLMLFRLMILRIYLEGLTMTKNRRN